MHLEMSDDQSTSTSPAVYANPWALRLGFALIVGFTLILGMVSFDNAHRSSMETFSETTSVGDANYFPLPDAAHLPVVGVTLNGKPLYVKSVEKVEVRDTHTQLAGKDDSQKLSIYTLAGSATEVEIKRVPAGVFLLKIEPGVYLAAHSVN